MRTAEQWAARPLGRNSALVLGWRRGAGVAAGRLNLARDMDQELRRRARASLAEIGGRVARSYGSAAQLEEDEAFLLTVNELPSRARKRRRSGRAASDGPGAEDEQEEASQIVELLRAPGDLDPIAADAARGRTFLFYAAVFSGSGSSIAFMKRHNPGGILKTGRLLGLFGDVVTRIDNPVLVFEPDFDLVLEGDEIAVLSPGVLARLFVDLEIATAAVPAHIAELRTVPLKFSEGTLANVAAACAKRRLLAGRLQRLVQADHLSSLTIEMVRQYVNALKEDPDRFIAAGEIAVVEDDVPMLLDILDQRHYRGGYDDLLRRADRNSLVPS